jgi:hypothetical protein
MTMDQDDLERHVHRDLARLPRPRAPRTLRPRVMEAVLPAVVGHPWFTWPWPLQMAAALMVVGLAAGVFWQWPVLMTALSSVVPESVQTSAGYLTSTAETASSVVRLLQLTWAGVVAPMAKLVLLLTVMLCTACAVCLAAFSRVALGGASQS